MSSIQPTGECRAIFSGHFYRMSSPQEADHMISPAAVHKLLLTISLGVDANLADKMLWDFYVKHVDQKYLREEARKEGIFDMGFAMRVRKRLEDELSAPIETPQLLEFFKNDFKELNDKITIENMLATDGKFEFKADYAQMAKEFFNVRLLKKNIKEEQQLISSKFPIELTESGLDIFGSVGFKLSLQAPMRQLDDGSSFEAFGEFKYGNLKNCNSLDFRTDVLELPLDGGLTMLVFIPNDFYTLLGQSIGRDYTHFNEISAQLESKSVHVKLPKFQLETKVNLRDFFAESSHRGLRVFFNEPIKLNRMLANADDIGFEVGKFWQHTGLEISAPKGSATAESAGEPAIVFDATQKSILFVIKSEKVLYVMGHFYKGK